MGRRGVLATLGLGAVGLLVPAWSVSVGAKVGPAVDPHAGHLVEQAVADGALGDEQQAAEDLARRHGVDLGAVDSAGATLRLADGRRAGTVRLYAVRPGETLVIATVRLPSGTAAGGTFHGFHVHANDNPANGSGCQADPGQPSSTWFQSADGHYAAPGQNHGAHTGDLPVLYLRGGGLADEAVVTDKFSPSDVVGRAAMVHVGPDNFGNIPTGSASTVYTPNAPTATALTAATGNAGDRLACGVIER